MNEEDMTNNELMIFFDGKFDSFKGLFDRIDESLKEIKIDLKNLGADIRGNGGGKIGLNVRIDRLETSKKQFFWVVSIVAVGIVDHYFSLVEKLINQFN